MRVKRQLKGRDPAVVDLPSGVCTLTIGRYGTNVKSYGTNRNYINIIQ